MNGVGGTTIEQAKRNLSFPEVRKWQAYRLKRGSLNGGLMVEAAIARLSTMYANAHSKDGGFTPHDFMPHHDRPEITLEQAMETWG